MTYLSYRFVTDSVFGKNFTRFFNGFEDSFIVKTFVFKSLTTE